MLNKLHTMFRKTISVMLYEIIQKDSLSPFSLSYSTMSKKASSLKLYLTFFDDEESEDMLNLLNRKYAGYIKKLLAKSHKFPSLPWITFYSDFAYEGDNECLQTED